MKLSWGTSIFVKITKKEKFHEDFKISLELRMIYFAF